MFYIEKDNKIILFDEDEQKLINTLMFLPQYESLEIKETQRPIKDFMFADTEEYKEYKKKERRNYLDNLSLTKREIFLALYKDKEITPLQLKELITDEEALIEFEYAQNYFRGNPLINLIGEELGYTQAELDYLFEHGEFENKENIDD